MHPLLQANLQADFAQLFSADALSWTPVDGWEPHLRRLFTVLQAHRGNARFFWMKRRFAGLEVCFRKPEPVSSDNSESDLRFDADTVEDESRLVCERCGEDGRVAMTQGAGGIRLRQTLCRECLDHKRLDGWRFSWAEGARYRW
ncbi:hypothetical protein HMN09_00995200 [Mycena chlorophos]|uniref:Uncharacterized protein n=1 Tax=Mycena chlorophos TaxID=658473 RepID=A0A8H6SJD6_MYCCL|nr:hypothetical protein HMN09_00995200 [Mycena chlorophos]